MPRYLMLTRCFVYMLYCYDRQERFAMMSPFFIIDYAIIAILSCRAMPLCHDTSRAALLLRSAAP